MDKKKVVEVLKRVYDPEHPISVVDLKIVDDEGIELKEGTISVTFTPTSPYCPMGGVLGVIIKYALEKKFSKEVVVNVKSGTHIHEGVLNDLLHDKDKYKGTLEKLMKSGILSQCVKI